MSIIFRSVLAGLITIFSLCVKAQSRRIDSLRHEIYHTKTDVEKLRAIIVLCDEYKHLNRDTLDYYSFLARELAIKVNDRRLQQSAELAVAYDYSRWGWTDSAIATVDPIIISCKVAEPQDRDLYFKASRVKAMANAGRSHFQDALTILYKIVSEAETYKDSLTLAENLNSIGSIALARNNAKEAIIWLSRALAASTRESRYDEIRAAVYTNMADAHRQSGKIDSAIIYSNKGITLFKQVGNLTSLALAMQKQSSIFIDAGNFSSAEIAFKEMLDLRKRSGDGNMYMDDNISLAEFYIQTKQVKKAIELCKNILMVGDVHAPLPADKQSYTNVAAVRLEYYQILARCYKLEGNAAQYQEVLEQIIDAKDSLYQHNSAQAIAELQTKYELQKKENTIMQQNLAITKKNNRFYQLLGIGVFLSIIALLLFTGYRKRVKLRTNAMLEEEKNMAMKSIAQAEEKERKRIAADLHDNLGAYAASIVSNLDLIELSMQRFHDEVAMQELRNNSQAIVSQLNDTIWALKKDGLSLTDISDRIKVFIQRIQNSYPAININVIENIEGDMVLSPSQAFHLFRILQEAINNALRHSGGNKIDVALVRNDLGWRITIADNGKGLSQNYKDGNGLINMRERAREIGCNIEWHSGQQNGVIVVISSSTTN